MAGYLFKNQAQSRILQDTASGSATVTVLAGEGALFPQPAGDGSDWFMLCLEDRRTGQLEICRATGRTGDIINVTRGQEGTVAQNFLLGATASHRMTAGTFTTYFANVYTKAEADAKFVDVTGDTMTGPLVLSANPTTGPQAANKAYVDLQVALINGIAEPVNNGLTYGRAFGVWNQVLTKTAADAADTTLQTNINTVQTNLNTTNTTVTAHGTHLTTIDGQITTLQGVDTSLQSQITSLNSTKLSDAPSDGKAYGRFNGAWAEVSQGGGTLGEYTFSTTITAPGLAAGELRFNSATPSLVTSIFASVTSALGIDLTTLFRVMTPGTTLFFQVKGDNTKYQVYTVIGTVTLASGVATIPVVSKTVGANLVAGRILVGSPGGGGAGLAAMTDVAPSNPQNGQLWWQSSTGVLYLFFDDGTSTQWVQADAPPTGPATDLDMVSKKIINVASINGGNDASFRNKVINGDFDFWQRATTQSTNGYGSDDRWFNANTGSTKVASQQLHTLGQTTVPGNPTFFSRTVVTSVANVANFVNKSQRIEGVKTLQGRTVTATFWAKADAAKNIALELQQNFGTGGAPSASVSMPLGLLALTTAWQKFVKVFTVPSITGRTLGTAGDNLELLFWMDAGANFATRASALGQRNGTYDISHVSLVDGDATAEDDCFSPRSITEELALCQRFYTTQSLYASGYHVTGNAIILSTPHKVNMRAVPTVAFPSPTYGNGSSISSPGVTADTIIWQWIVTGTGGSTFNGSYTADAEL